MSAETTTATEPATDTATNVTTAGTIAADAPKVRSPLARAVLSRDSVMVALLLVLVFLAVALVPRFGTAATAGYLLLNAVPALLLALPMTLIIITGEVDLSVASIVGLSAATIGSLTMSGWSFAPAVLVAVMVGLAAGALNGFLIAFVGLPSLAVTIGTLALYRGLALVVLGDKSVSASTHPKAVTQFVTSKLGSSGVPTLIIPVIVVIVLFMLLLQYSPFGRGLYALGYSKEAARFVGVRVSRAKFLLFVLNGLMASLVGVFWVLYYSARSDSATGLELTVIAAVLLGGVSIFGGRGTIIGAVAGVLMIAVINYALRLQRIPDVTLVIITGSLLILSVVGPSVFVAARQWLHVRRVRQSLPSASRPGTTVA